MKVVGLKSAIVVRFGLPFLTIALVAAKPLVDAFSERSREVVVSPGAVWTALAFTLGAAWLISRRTLTWAQVMILGSLGGLILCAAISYRYGGNLTGVALEASRVVVGFIPGMMLLGELHQRPLRRFRRYLALFVAGVVLHSIVAVFQYIGVFPSTYFQLGVGRPSGLYYHPVSFGILLNVSLLIVVTAQLRGWLRPLWVGGISIALIMLLVMSSHRTSMAVAVVIILGWGVIYVLTLGSRLRVSLKGLVLGFLALALVVSIASLSSRSVGQVVQRAVNNVVGVLSVEDFDPAGEGFLRGRGERWERAIDAIQFGSANERLFGHGTQIVDPHTDFLRGPLVHGFIGTLFLVVGLAALAGGYARACDITGRRLVWLIVLCTLVYALTTKPTSYPFYMWAVSLVAWLIASSSKDRGLALDGGA